MKVDVVCADVFEAPVPTGTARLVYADPPYTEEDYFGYGTAPAWGSLVERMVELAAPDAVFVLHCGTANLGAVLAAIEEHAPKRRARFKGAPKARVLAWVKEWTSWRPNVAFQYAWEPIVVFYGSKHRQPMIGKADAQLDWVCLPPQPPRFGHPTEKPEKLIVWLFDRLLHGCRGRVAVDLFAGTGTAALVASSYGMDAIAVERGEKWAALIDERAREAVEGRLSFLERVPIQDRLLDVEQSERRRWRETRARETRLGGGIARKEKLAGRLPADG